MNRLLVFKLVGTALKYESYLMMFPLAVSLLHRESDWPFFLFTMILASAIGFYLSGLKPSDSKFRSREGFAVVALTWLICSVFGALPYYFSGYFDSFIDCFFESVSGFTTTGATILTDIERLPPGLLFWRSFTQWIGGIGVLVFTMTIMTSVNPSAVNVSRVEYSGPSVSKVVPRIRQSVRIIYSIYIGMTLIVVILLKLAGFSFFDSFLHAFSVAGTGGFSNMNMSVAAFNNPAAEVIIAVSVFFFCVNFSIYFQLLKRNFKIALKDEELICYTIFVLVSTFIIMIDIGELYGSLTTALRHSFFQVTSVITSSGFFSADFNVWPVLSRLVLILLMLAGGSSGSTGCGLKMIRVLILGKAVKAELNKIIHPRAVSPVKINGKNADKDVIDKVFMYFFVYFTLIIVASLIISYERHDLVTTVSAVIASVSNTGPGLELVGPLGSFDFFSPVSKLVLSFCMLAGRLEIYPLLILFSSSIWKKTAVG